MGTKSKAAVVVVSMVATALMVTACGSASSSAGVKSAADAAKAIGCTASSPASTSEIYVTDLATCTINGTEVKVYYFSTSDALNSYVEIAGQFGGQYLVFSNYLVDANPSVLSELQKSVGGDIKP